MKFAIKYLLTAIEYKRLFNPDRYIGTYFRLNGTIVSRFFHADGMRMNGSMTESYDFEPESGGNILLDQHGSPHQFGFRVITKNDGVDFRLHVQFNEKWDEYGYALENRFLITKNIFLYLRGDKLSI